jgi:glycosyltransferase involved in cell wall biosynthesis
MPLVTIVFGTYKRSHIIGRTLTSLINQTCKDFEIVIIDDNHPENIEEVTNTKQVIDAFNDTRIHYFKNTQNLGHPAVFRKCFDHVKGKYFMLFSDDDELHEEALQLMVNLLETTPEACLAHGADSFKYPDGTFVQNPLPFDEIKTIDTHTYLKSHFAYDDKFNWSQSAVLYRTEHMRYNKVPVVDNYMWDLVFHCHYLLHGKKVGSINKHLCIRNEEIRYTGRLSGNILFYRNVEIFYMISRFINEHAPILIAKGFSVNELRLKNSFRMLQEFIHIKNFQHSLFCLEIALKDLLKLAFLYVLWLPVKLISVIYGKITAVFSLIK